MKNSCELQSFYDTYYGEEISDEQAKKLRERVEAAYPQYDVEMLSGGQPIYYYIVSVE